MCIALYTQYATCGHFVKTPQACNTSIITRQDLCRDWERQQVHETRYKNCRDCERNMTTSRTILLPLTTCEDAAEWSARARPGSLAQRYRASTLREPVTESGNAQRGNTTSGLGFAVPGMRQGAGVVGEETVHQDSNRARILAWLDDVQDHFSHEGGRLPHDVTQPAVSRNSRQQDHNRGRGSETGEEVFRPDVPQGRSPPRGTPVGGRVRDDFTSGSVPYGIRVYRPHVSGSEVEGERSYIEHEFIRMWPRYLERREGGGGH